MRHFFPFIATEPHRHLASRPQSLRTGLGRSDDPPRAVRLDVQRPHVVGLYFVTPDNEAGGLLAVEHLLAAGHRKTGFAKGSSWAGLFNRRQAGWTRGLRKAGIVPRPEWVLIDPGEGIVRGTRSDRAPKQKGRPDRDAL